MDIYSRQVVLDLETLSTRSNAAIVSIGAVAIDNLEIVDTFYINVDAKTCKEAGLHIDPLTVEWWSQQDMVARQALTVDPVPLDEAIDTINDIREELSDLPLSLGKFPDFPNPIATRTETGQEVAPPLSLNLPNVEAQTLGAGQGNQYSALTTQQKLDLLFPRG